MTTTGPGITCPGCGLHMPLRGAYAAGLTRRQMKLLDLFANYAARGERLPNYEQIASEIGTKAKSSIARMVLALTEDGFITRRPSRSASINLTAKATALYVEVQHA